VGKTTFADDLADRIKLLGRPAIRLDSDGFHHVRAIRHRQGRESARGYYEDAYDFDSLRDFTLRPLGGRGPYKYATRVHELETDEAVCKWAMAPREAVVLFDATFVQRGQLRDHWDEVVYLDASIDRAQTRGIMRDAEGLGGVDNAAVAYKRRYMAACRIYLAEERPCERASILVDHNEPTRPSLRRY